MQLLYHKTIFNWDTHCRDLEDHKVKLERLGQKELRFVSIYDTHFCNVLIFPFNRVNLDNLERLEIPV